MKQAIDQNPEAPPPVPKSSVELVLDRIENWGVLAFALVFLTLVFGWITVFPAVGLAYLAGWLT